MSDTGGGQDGGSIGAGRIAGRVALITGAASGIGRAAAALFGREGASVLLVDSNAEAGEAAVAAIRAGKDARAGNDARAENGARAGAGTRDRARYAFQRADVTRDADCRAAVQRAVSEFGGLHILFNNAGIMRRASVLEMSVEEWDRTMAVNVKSIYLMSRAAIPVMVAGGGGTIVNTASGWGIAAGPRAAAYCASKGAVVLLTKAMAIDHAPQKIRVNCLCPGDTDTPMLRGEAAQTGTPVDRFLSGAAQRPLGRVGRPEEIAAAALYLAGDASEYVTGTALIVDGGGLAGSV